MRIQQTFDNFPSNLIASLVAPLNYTTATKVLSQKLSEWHYNWYPFMLESHLWFYAFFIAVIYYILFAVSDSYYIHMWTHIDRTRNCPKIFNIFNSVYLPESPAWFFRRGFWRSWFRFSFSIALESDIYLRFKSFHSFSRFNHVFLVKKARLGQLKALGMSLDEGESICFRRMRTR